jgi:signal transduction histidine kinase
MRFPIRDTIFLRLFLLMFFTLTLSFMVGRELLTGFGLHATAPGGRGGPHPFLLSSLLFRLTGIALAAWVAARWLAKPIQRMAQAAYELGANLNHPALDEHSGPAEVRQAAAVFNQMQVRLKSHMAERSRFLAAISHDLRTPLTRMKLRAEKIADPRLQASVQQDLNEMAAMIDAALDYLRGTGQPEPFQRLDVASLVYSLAEDAEYGREAVAVSGGCAPVMAQPMAVRRCLNNLIENAIRYGESADILIEETADRVTISIADHGPGIPEDKMEAVFSPFFRLEESRNRNTGGIGLGLSIARDIARQQGGALTLKNGPVAGLVATLTLNK